MADVFDITPGLIARVDEYYRARCMANASLPRLAKKLEEGKATYDDAYKYAEAIGQARADAFAHEVSSDVLPDGRMYYNIAERLMDETLSADHEVVAEYASGVQELINEKNGISLAAQTADLDRDRIKGFVEGICNAEVYDDVAWKLGAPVVTHARTVVDDTVRKNAEFQNKAGIKATVTRNAAAKCCEWCNGLDGDYTYPNVPSEVFQRHDNCRCTVDYKGRRLSAYNSGGSSHSFRDQGERERIQERISELESARGELSKVRDIAPSASSKKDSWIRNLPLDARDKYAEIIRRGTDPMRHGFSCFSDSLQGQLLSLGASKIEPKEGFFDVAMHGNPTAVCFGTDDPNMSPRLLASVIKKHPDYNGEKIRLFCCRTGETVSLKGQYCFAEELANNLGVIVEAPDDLLYIISNGEWYVGMRREKSLVPFSPNQRGRLK